MPNSRPARDPASHLGSRRDSAASPSQAPRLLGECLLAYSRMSHTRLWVPASSAPPGDVAEGG